MCCHVDFTGQYTALATPTCFRMRADAELTWRITAAFDGARLSAGLAYSARRADMAFRRQVAAQWGHRRANAAARQRGASLTFGDALLRAALARLA